MTGIAYLSVNAWIRHGSAKYLDWETPAPALTSFCARRSSIRHVAYSNCACRALEDHTIFSSFDVYRSRAQIVHGSKNSARPTNGCHSASAVAER